MKAITKDAYAGDNSRQQRAPADVELGLHGGGRHRASFLRGISLPLQHGRESKRGVNSRARYAPWARWALCVVWRHSSTSVSKTTGISRVVFVS